MNIANLIKPTGVIAFVLMVFTLLIGTKLIKMGLSWHRILAIIAVFFALCHALIILYLTYL